ncbi:MAG: hypothetical protein ABI878_09725 [Acidobacteriota bacterium]
MSGTERTMVEKIADAVLYEGYMLYPYRASSVKNKQRFNWGALAPKAYSDAQNGTEAFEMRTQCLIQGDTEMEVSVKVRFLHLMNREIGRIAGPSNEIPDDLEFVSSLDIDGELYQAWQEVVEQNIEITAIRPGDTTLITPFSFAAGRDVEPIKNKDGKIAGAIVRTRREIMGEIETRIESDASAPAKLTLIVRNTTPLGTAADATRDEALLSSCVSTHSIFNVSNGAFVSLLEPPDEFAAAAASCENKGAFPILVGTAGERDCMLSSPIILYDYPEIAPESPGDLFDSTEIDEILTLRIMTMTDQEKREMRAIDERARKILERTEFMTDDQFLNMHGTLRGMERSKRAGNG